MNVERLIVPARCDIVSPGSMRAPCPKPALWRITFNERASFRYCDDHTREFVAVDEPETYNPSRR